MSGNGVDIAAVYELLRSVADTVITHDQRFARMEERMGRGFSEARRAIAELSRNVGEVRRELASYHASVVGHGILITELDERVSRLERHVGLSA